DRAVERRGVAGRLRHPGLLRRPRICGRASQGRLLSRRRSLLLFLPGILACALLLAPALPAAADSFEIPATDVAVELAEDGSLRVTERITFSYDGSFTGAFREIP